MKKVFYGLVMAVFVFVSVLPTTVFALDWEETQPAGDTNVSWHSIASDADGSNLIAASFRLYTSSDGGANWTERQPAGDTNRRWNAVASDADGSNLIAVYGEGGDFGTQGRIYTSSDGGANWTERQPLGDVEIEWRVAASDADGSHLVVGVNGGDIYTSTDGGANWTERQPGGDITPTWNALASDADGSNLIATYSGGRLYTSSDGGANWTERQPVGDMNAQWVAVASDSDGTNLVAAINNGRLYTSSDGGANWTERQPAGDVNRNWWSVASDADGSNLVAAVFNGRLYVSDDGGANWTEEQPEGDANKWWQSVASGDDGSNLFVAINSGRLYISAPDEVAPTISVLSPADNATGVALDLFNNAGAVITFDENVVVATGTATVYNASNDAIVATFDVEDGNYVFISDGADVYLYTEEEEIALEYETTYYILVDAGAFEDEAGNPFAGIADPTTWNFTTRFAPALADLEFERVSVDDEGGEANGESYNRNASISADGRYVAFESNASNLVEGDENDQRDIFVYDRNTNTIERVSVDDEGGEANGGSESPSISASGRYVAFESNASNLVEGDENDTSDIFVYDRNTNIIERVSVNDEGGEANNGSSAPSISADGRYVAFRSYASNLVEDDENDTSDIFVYDRNTSTIERVSVDDEGGETNGEPSNPSISADGRYVAFESNASNLVEGDENDQRDIFVYDRNTNTIERVSVNDEGGEANNGSYAPSISADGRYIAFESYASNLVDGDENDTVDVFVYDRTLDTIERIGDDIEYSYDSSISANGRYVAFARSTDDGEGNTEGVFRYDRQEDELLFVTEGALSYEEYASYSYYPALSEDGLVLAFASDADNLVAGDTNEQNDVFVYVEVAAEEPGDDEDQPSGGGGSSGGGSSSTHRRSGGGGSSSGSQAPSAGSAPGGDLESLITLLRSLLQQFVALGGALPPGAAQYLNAPSSEVSVFTRDLSLGSTGEDVRALQQFLINQNKGPAAQALAANGTTQLFGPLTQAALAEYQASVGIAPAVGYFGPITRAHVGNL